SPSSFLNTTHQVGVPGPVGTGRRSTRRDGRLVGLPTSGRRTAASLGASCPSRAGRGNERLPVTPKRSPIDRSFLPKPGSSPRRRLATANSTRMPAANTTHRTGTNHTSARGDRLMKIRLRNLDAASHGFTNEYSSPRFISAAVSTLQGRDNSVGSNTRRKRHRLTSMLVLFELHHVLTSMPKPAMAGARRLPSTLPHSSACPNTGSPLERTAQ